MIEARYCPGCETFKALTRDHWHFRKRRTGYFPVSECKVCVNAKRRGRRPPRTRTEDYRQRQREWSRARARAQSRLQKLCPELWQDLLREELDRIGFEPRRDRAA